jgi:hypothetical protein
VNCHVDMTIEPRSQGRGFHLAATIVIFSLALDATGMVAKLMSTAVELDIPKYPVKPVANALGISVGWIRKYQALFPLLKEHDVQGGLGRGHKSLFTPRTVMRMAIMLELTRWGISAENALSSAVTFADIGSGGGGFMPPEGETVGQSFARMGVKRGSGGYFPSGRTCLLITNRDEPGQLVNTFKESVFLVPSATALVVDCKDIFDRVLQRLAETVEVQQ